MARQPPVAKERSALDCVVQVQHSVALDDLVRIVKEDGADVAAEEAHPSPRTTGATFFQMYPRSNPEAAVTTTANCQDLRRRRERS